MVFKESETENDGKIKREAGKEMAKVAQTQNSQMWQHFVNVAEEIGRDPADILGEMAVRSLSDEEFAQRIFNSEVSMRDLQSDRLRMEDVEYVQELSEKFGLNKKDGKKDPIERLVNERIQSVTESPISRFRGSSNMGQSSGEGQSADMSEVEERLARMEQRLMDDGSGDHDKQQDVQSEEKKSVDSLFGDGNEDGEEQEKQTTDQLWDDEEPEDDVEEEDMDDDAIDEALDGVVNDSEPEKEQEAEELDVNLDIPAEREEEEDSFYTSEDGEDE